MIPISKRLIACAELVPRDARVADIGCDHGYLGIYLLKENRASFVISTDLREKPLESAKKNALKFGVSDRMAFFCADGLQGIAPDQADTIVCAGMGGDLIRMVLERSPWSLDGCHTLILQPQSSQYELRTWLCRIGFQIERETPVSDAGHVYSAMRLRFTGASRDCEPLEAFVSDALLRSGSPDLAAYLDDTIRRLTEATEIMKNAGEPPKKLSYFLAALEGVREVKRNYGNST